jgi:hypothetical protein
MNHNLPDPDPVAELSKSGWFARILPEPVERQTFVRQNYIQLKGVLRASFTEALSSEARRVLSAMHSVERGESLDPVEQGLTALSSQTTSVPAPLLVHLHLSLIPFVRALTGQLLVPAHAWYNFYVRDDGMRLHVDTEGSELVLLSTVLGEVGPLHLHPNLSGRSQDELEAIQKDPNWKTESGVPIYYPRLGLLAHRGHLVPHHRLGRTVSEPSAVAALHYSSLF